MKRIIVVAVVVAFALMSATAAMAAIANSKHDLSSTSTATIHASVAGLSSCQFCHTPHNSATVTGAPLWNRSIKAVSGYTLYGTTIGGTAITTLGPNSLTCLSCHDGTLSVGDVLVGGLQSITGAGQTGGLLDATNVNNLSTNLQNDHPVGFVVDTTKAGLGSVALSVLTGKGFKFYGASNNTMECATCHEPHDNVTNPPFLKRAKSTICSDCHIQK